MEGSRPPSAAEKDEVQFQGRLPEGGVKATDGGTLNGFGGQAGLSASAAGGNTRSREARQAGGDSWHGRRWQLRQRRECLEHAAPNGDGSA